MCRNGVSGVHVVSLTKLCKTSFEHEGFNIDTSTSVPVFVSLALVSRNLKTSGWHGHPVDVIGDDSFSHPEV